MAEKQKIFIRVFFQMKILFFLQMTPLPIMMIQLDNDIFQKIKRAFSMFIFI